MNREEDKEKREKKIWKGRAKQQLFTVHSWANVHQPKTQYQAHDNPEGINLGISACYLGYGPQSRGRAYAKSKGCSLSLRSYSSGSSWE